MKFYDTHFEEYLHSNEKKSLHPTLSKSFNSFPSSLVDLQNLIIYGPKGVGKYTQMLSAIKKYSPSDLKYEKRISVSCGKSTYVFKISDIHFEIDMSLLGCNSKTLWNDIYNHIIDIVLARSDNIGIIVCKYFHEIHSELLETFYSYMQTITNSPISIKFILLTEQISFIPDNITQRCYTIRVSRPSRSQYNLILKEKLPRDLKLSEISNIKNYIASITPLGELYKSICDNLLVDIKDLSLLKYSSLRENLYDIFIYNLDVTDCIWYIFETLIKSGHLKDSYTNEVLLRMTQFFQYYNNNYRPIYHLESFILFLCKKVHEIQ